MKRLTKWQVVTAMVLLVALLSASLVYGDIDSPTVGKWMLDGNYLDSSGYGNNGTAGNSPTLVNDGVHRQAYRFDRNDQEYIQVPDNPYLNFGTGSFSISCWFRISHAYYWMTMVDKRNYNGAGYQIYSYDGTNVIFKMSDAGGTASFTYTGDLVDDRWHNAVATVNRSTNRAQLYIDGSPVPGVGGGVPRPGSVANYSPFYIGRSSAGEYFNGDIDEVMAYRLALSEDEVKEIYLNGAVYDELFWEYRKCQAKWNMDGNALDASGNTNNGILHGGPLLPEIVDGVHNWALDFNGTNYISVPNDPTINLGMTPRGAFGSFTISFWVKTSSSGTIIDKRTIVNSTYTGYLVQLYDGRPLLQMADGTGWWNFYPPYDPLVPRFDNGEWYFMVFTVDRRLHDMDFYVYRRSDRRLFTYGFDSGTILGDMTNTSDLYIGRNINSLECFKGTLDDIKIYNKFLRSDDVAEQFRAHQLP